jgi:hypothetical protein
MRLLWKSYFLNGSLLRKPLGFVKTNDAATQNGGRRMLSHFARPLVSKTEYQR